MKGSDDSSENYQVQRPSELTDMEQRANSFRMSEQSQPQCNYNYVLPTFYKIIVSRGNY